MIQLIRIIHSISKLHNKKIPIKKRWEAKTTHIFYFTTTIIFSINFAASLYDINCIKIIFLAECLLLFWVCSKFLYCPVTCRVSMKEDALSLQNQNYVVRIGAILSPLTITAQELICLVHFEESLLST